MPRRWLNWWSYILVTVAILGLAYKFLHLL
jgi:hypothetical protein